MVRANSCVGVLIIALTVGYRIFGIDEFIVITTLLLVAVGVLRQLAFDVSMHLITSPLLRELSVYVELLVPTLTLFFCHWNIGVVPPLVIVAVKVTEVPLQI